ncbi:hypothetical protein [Paenibacillus sp. S150]|uniref:hypothetical protein n=1 Tax=Paenibacillus sp. S150 TaxID=2749826 RepID=UPI001C593EF5|nr:hypothetical protein [Paenibacillus sp. S150]MBW4084769.1 hypothetical protein [Paenibacillus sp. S150]
MPYLTTDTLTSRPARGLGTISQIVVKMVNNGLSKAVVYITGLNNDVTPQTFFAQELFEVNYREVVTRTYNITQIYFQLNAVYSQELLQIQIFLVDTAGICSTVPMEPLRVGRITSEFREDIAVTAADFPAISFRRNAAIAIPEAVASEIRTNGLEILASTPIRYKVIAGGTVNGTFVNFPTPTTAIPVTATALQVNYTSTTITGGRVITQGLGSGIAGAYQNAAVNLLNQLLYNLTDEAVTLTVSSLAGADNVAAAFRMSELW